LRAGASVVDIMGGMAGVIGVLAALRERDSTGQGQLVKAALFDLNAGKFVEVPMLSRQRMAGGQSFAGPGLIKDDGTTICVPENYTAHCGKGGHIIMTRQTVAGGG